MSVQREWLSGRKWESNVEEGDVKVYKSGKENWIKRWERKCLVRGKQVSLEGKNGAEDRRKVAVGRGKKGAGM